MKKIVFLTCDDLSGFVVDDNAFFETLKTTAPEIQFEVLSWSDPTVDWSQFDYAVIRTTWDYTKRLKEFTEALALIESKGCKVLNPISVVQWNSNKNYLKELSRKGLPVVKSYFLEDSELLAVGNQLEDQKKYVLKPIVGASADDILVLSGRDMRACLENLKTPSNWFLQPFIDEVLDGERSLFYFNSVFSHAALKVPKAGDFRVQEEHGGLITSYEPTEKDLDFGNLVLKTLGENLLYSRVDFLQTAEGPKLIELELIEPSLYFRVDPKSCLNFVKALKSL